MMIKLQNTLNKVLRQRLNGVGILLSFNFTNSQKSETPACAGVSSDNNHLANVISTMPFQIQKAKVFEARKVFK